MKRHIGLGVLASSLASAVALAQPGGEPPTEGAPEADVEVVPMPAPLSVHRVDSRGLPQATVQAIVQDTTGFMWLGTESGLARYDGHRMIAYRADPGDPKKLSSGWIDGLAAIDGGRVLVATPEGLNVYDPDTDEFTRFRHDPAQASSMSSDGVAAVFRDRKGRAWLGMREGGLNRFDPAAGTFEHYLKPPLDAPVTAIAEDSHGDLWLGTPNGQVLRFDPATGAATGIPLQGADADGELTVNAIAVDAGDLLWVGTDAGLFSYAPATKKLASYESDPNKPTSLSHPTVTALLIDKGANLWVATQNGLNHYDREKNSFLQHHHEPENQASLPYPWLRALYQDREGIIWVGTKGVALFDELRQRIRTYRARGFSPLRITETRDGALWVGTVHGGLFRFDRAEGRMTVYNVLRHPRSGEELSLREDLVVEVFEGKDGVLWLGLGQGGLVRFHPQSGEFKQFLYEGKPMWINGILEHPNGEMWLSSWGTGLLKFDPKRGEFIAIYNSDNSGLTSDHLYEARLDVKDPSLLWIGTGQGGLLRVNLNDNMNVTSFLHDRKNPKSLSHNDVQSMYQAPSGELWAATYGGGLNRLANPSTGEFERFTVQNSGLTHNDIFGIIPDNAGKLWISTNGGGLVQFDPAKKTFTRWSVEDGLQSDEFVQGAFGRSAKGELYFGGLGGVSAFFPEQLVRSSYVAPVVIDGLEIFNQQIRRQHPMRGLPGGIEISYDDSFQFNFAALSYGAPDQNRYAYKLEGFDDDWIESSNPFAAYTKLGGGDYVFRVRAANRHGVWNEQGTSISFEVDPIFWLSWKAYILYAVIVIGLALAVVTYYRARIRRLEQATRLHAVERDLELTGAVQAGFLPPQNHVQAGDFKLFGFYRPMESTSGDWWWYESFEDGKLFVLVGDVTGHGPGPAMVTAAVATALRVTSGTGVYDTPQKLEVLNQEVLRVGNHKYQMTAVAVELDPRTLRFEIYSAGGPPLMRLDSAGNPRTIPCKGTPLGTIDFRAGHAEGQFGSTDRFMLYSDGILEVDVGGGRLLGNRRFAQIFQQTREMPLDQAAANIVQSADRLRAGPQQDDWTFALVELTPAQREAMS